MGAVFLAAAIPVGATAAEREQLPSGVTPIHYDLALVPDAANLTFRGRVKITIHVKAPVPVVVLNDDELVIDRAMLDKEQAGAAVSLAVKPQRATLTFAHPVARGNHTLTIDYHGVIRPSTHGFFAMDYDSPAGKRRTIATTFEPATERRFMPSWDEPALKATFTISTDVSADRMAVSNMPVASTETLASGQRRVHFATTPRMSTYLLFLGIGDFERIATKVDGTEVGVVVSRGDAEKGRYALGEAARLLHYYNDYFGIRYPLPKLDLVAAPGAMPAGAMENWGAIFYSQAALLFDPKSSTEADRQEVFSVIAHEMAHQWFGDLVTMAWWDDLWLNEGFAEWMQTKAAGDLHPEWKTELRALSIAEVGKRADAKPSTHSIVRPVLTASQAEQALDAITYYKGAAVIGMLEAYVGPVAFRDGIRSYMRAHAYGNTIDADLWREVQAAAGKPVLQMEADFTQQPGVPLIRVETRQTSGGTKVTVSEGRFAEDPATIVSAPVQTWLIPVTVNAGGASTAQLLFGLNPITLEVQSTGTGTVIINADHSSYARTLYPQAMIEALGTQMAYTKPVEQLGFLYDAWALGQSGYAPVTNYLDLAGAVPPSADPIVWEQIVSTLVSIDRLYSGDTDHEAFTTFARRMLRPLADRLGWDAQNKEESNVSVLREAVLVALSRFGDQSVVTEARRRFVISLRNPQEVPPAVRRTALLIVAHHADAETLDLLISRLRATPDPLEKENLVRALADIADPSGARRVLELALSSDAPAGTTEFILTRVSAAHPDLSWNFALQHLDQIWPLTDSRARFRLMPAIASRSADRVRAADLQTYADQNIPSGTRQDVEAAIATIALNGKFRAERLPEIGVWLARKTAPNRASGLW
jgi:aminopeptidase N